MNFRADINALRALAILAVVIFHFNSNLLSGGFAGVDVFFVISGFLMTSIVFRGIENNTFSLFGFYVSRANRIVPALAFLCLTLIILGAVFLRPLDLLILGKHVAASVTFVSNILYSKESGYFDAASHEKFLLHTWSLSVEWQFYIVYPAIILILKKFLSIKQLKILIVSAAVFCFLVSVYISFKKPVYAYFLLPTRAWEMMVGGVAFLYPFALSVIKKKLLFLGGLFLMFFSFVFISQEDLWPGYLALLPVLGTFFVIVANTKDSFFMNNSLVQRIGKWSYSIYLWHWPIVVCGYYFSVNNWIIIGIPLSILFGWLSFKYIESLNLQKQVSWRKFYLVKPVYYSFFLFIAGLIVFKSTGLLFKYPSDMQQYYLSAIEATHDWNYPEPNLIIDNKAIRFIKGSTEKNILFIGDSHIEHLYPYFSNLNGKYNIYFLTSPGCFVTPSQKNPKWSCSNIQGYKSLFENVKFDKVVTSFYCFDSYLSKFEKVREHQIQQRILEYDAFLKDIKTKANQVYLILGEPKGKEFDPKLAVRTKLKRYITKDIAKKNYLVHEYALSKLTEKEGVIIIDPIELLCEERCDIVSTSNEFFYKDSNHMRPWYVKNKLNYLKTILD